MLSVNSVGEFRYQGRSAVVVSFPVRREQAMLRYAIVLQVALVATAASSAPDTQPTTIDKMSTVDAIKACRAELGRHGRYSQVRKCVSQKRMSTVEAINACRAELERISAELNRDSPAGLDS